MTAQCPAHPQSSPFNTHKSFICCSFYFNLKQMVAHRCEQLWPLEHKEQTLALSVPLPPPTQAHSLGPLLPTPSCLSCPWAAALQQSASLCASLNLATGEEHLVGRDVGAKTLRKISLGHVLGGVWGK